MKDRYRIILSVVSMAIAYRIFTFTFIVGQGCGPNGCWVDWEYVYPMGIRIKVMAVAVFFNILLWVWPYIKVDTGE